MPLLQPKNHLHKKREEKTLFQKLFSSLSSIVLASSYCPVGLPPKYRRRCSVSPLSSGWVSVVPPRHKHQEYSLKTLKAA